MHVLTEGEARLSHYDNEFNMICSKFRNLPAIMACTKVQVEDSILD
jgi:hypothetical protein